MGKSLWTADPHVGSAPDWFVTKSGIERSVEDQMRQLDVMIDRAKAEEADAFVILGDIYDENKPKPVHNRLFIERMNALDELGITTYLLVGNHDASNSGEHALSPIKRIRYRNIVVVDKISRVKITGHDVIFVPHITRKDVGAVDADQYAERVSSYIADGIRPLLASCKGKVVLATHSQFPGAVSGSEETMLRGGVNPLPEIDKKKVGLIMLGHVHKRQALRYGSISGYYCGSPTRNDFGERNDDKGFLWLDDKMEVEFEDLSPAKFAVVTIDLVSKDRADLDDDKIRAVAQDKVLKVVINVSDENKNKVSVDEILNKFRKWGFVSKTELNVVRAKKKSKIKKAISLKPSDAVQRYVKKNVAEERQEAVLAESEDILARCV